MTADVLEESPLVTVRRPPPPQARANILARAEEKRAAVLAWLGAEIFSSARILGQVMGLKRSQTYQTLAAMRRDCLVDFQTVELHAACIQIVVLTPHGAALAGAGGDGYKQGKVAASSIDHQLDVQQARLYLQGAGWSDWESEFELRERAGNEARDAVPLLERKWPKVPDGVGRSPLRHDEQGQARGRKRVAIEMERSIKTSRSYKAIVGEYLHMVDLGVIDGVMYVTKSARVRDALRSKVAGLPDILMPEGVTPGGKLAYESCAFEDSDKKKFVFRSLDDLKAASTEADGGGA